jgi:hypothetical protein|nr:hypothetical protein [Streptomyces glaucescens]
MRLILHPDGLASQFLDFADVRAHPLGRLVHQVNATGHSDLRELYDEVSDPAPPNLDETSGLVDPWASRCHCGSARHTERSRSSA